MKQLTTKYIIGLNYEVLIRHFVLTEKQLNNIIKNHVLNEKNWKIILSRRILSNEFITRHWNDLNILYVLRHQKITEEFIYQHQDLLKYKFHWDAISKVINKEFSEKFFIDFHDKLDIEFIYFHQKVISDDLYLRLNVMKRLME